MFGSKGWETNCADVFQITKGFSMNERGAESAKVVREFPQFGNLDKMKCVAASITDEKAFTEKIFSTSAQKLTDLLFLSLTATFRARVSHPSDTGEREAFLFYASAPGIPTIQWKEWSSARYILWSLWHFVASPVPVLDVLNALLYITFVLVLAVIFFSNLRNKHV